MENEGLGTEVAIVIGLVIGIAVGFGGGYFAFSSPEQYSLNTSVTPSGGGSINVTPVQETYDKDTEVSLEAAPNSDYTFDYWEGDYPSGKKNDNTIQLKMNSDKEITAHFSEKKGLTYEQLLQDYQISGDQGNFSSYNSGESIEVRMNIENMGVIKENELPPEIVDNLKQFGFSLPVTLVKSGSEPTKPLPQVLLFSSDLSAKYEKGDTATLTVHVFGSGDAEVLIEWIPSLDPNLGKTLSIIAFQ